MEASLYDRLPSMLLNADSRSHAHLLNRCQVFMTDGPAR